MKKLVLILALLIAIPGAAFGMEMLDDSKLDNVTGQSGVNIVFDDIQMFINIERMAYIDNDGFSSTLYVGPQIASSEGGAIAIDDFQIDVMNINAIYYGSFDGTVTALSSGTASGIDLQFGEAAGTGYGDSTTELYNFNVGGTVYTGLKGLENYDNVAGGVASYTAKALTIDVTAALPVTSQAITRNAVGSMNSTLISVGGVMIGLPTAEISINDMYLTPTYYCQNTNLGTLNYNDGDDYGSFLIQGLNMAVLNGWLEISPH